MKLLVIPKLYEDESLVPHNVRNMLLNLLATISPDLMTKQTETKATQLQVED